jgi:16S rRNA (cytidine1402-2'-O)-methyltransferase
MPATLFVVSTPIGNLEDVTLRALRILREVAVVAAEDTRHTARLLQHYQIPTPMVSYHEHNERERTPGLLARLEAGESVALVSDAGTPLLSDPGFHLVREAIDAGIRVESVPGPSAFTAALAVSGLPLDRVTFLAFPPPRRAERASWLAELAGVRGTLVFFEAPHRIRATLEDLIAQLGDRYVVIARELTKMHESVIRGWLSEILIGQLEERGECVVMVSDQKQTQGEITIAITDDRLVAEFGELTKNNGCSPRDAVTTLALRHGVPKQRIYKATNQRT